MDKQLLAALDNLSIALEMLSESLSKKDSSSPVASAVKSGNFEDQLKSISKGIADIKSDNKKILDNQETILKLQREKKDKSMNAFEGSGKENNKKMLKDGISIIVLIAGAVLAIGLAFKLIGTVDWKSVLSISIALPMMAYAFEKVAQVKDLTPSKVFMVGLALVGISVAIALSSRILQKVVPIGLFQAITVVFIAAAFGAAAVGLGFLLKAFKDIKAADALKASAILPLVLIGVSIAIAGSSRILQFVQPIGIAQAFTVVVIAAAFGVVSFGLGKLLGAFKNIKASDAMAAAKLMPIILIALSVAIVGASYLFSLIRPIGFFQALTAIVIAATFVVLSYSVKPLMNGVKGVNPKDIITGTIVLLALSAAVVAVSWLLMLMAPVPFTNLIKFLILSFSLSISVMALALSVKFVNKLGNPKDYFEGGLSIVIMATTIMISSWMISMGTYTNYPPLMWTLFSGLSIAAFALVTWLVVKLGSVKDYVQGGLSIVILSATIMISSYLISAGDYSNYPPIMWSIGTVISIGLFGVAAVLLSTLLLNPMFYMGLAVIVIIAASIVAVSYILEQGTYKVYPPDEWVNSTMLLIGKFALIASVLAFASPFIALGTVSLILIVGMIYLIDRAFSTGRYDKYPNEMWQRGVTLTISKFASLIKDVRRIVGFGDLFFGIIKIIGLVESLVKIDEIFSEGRFEKYPKKEWVDGSFYAIEKISELVGKQSIFAAIGEAIGDFFGVGGKSTVLKLVDGIVQIDNAFSKGNFTKYPKVEWVNGTIYALQKFHTILDMLSFNSGGFSDSISNLFGGKSPIEQTVSDITLLAMAFEKLGSAMNSFSSSINSLDAEKLGLVRGMSSNIILMSLMDPDMLEGVLDKIEEKGGIFAELIKDFDDKKTTSPTATPVRVATTGTAQKSDSQILGEKVDKMTGLLADISSVVGSRGALKNYLLSVKDNQLSSSGGAPSSGNRSDRRLKNILKKIGQSNLGINIYHFTYTFNTKVIYQGVIAQELIGTQFEGALIMDKNGFYSVDYSKLDVEFKKISTSNTF
jgi:hypothetical protein